MAVNNDFKYQGLSGTTYYVSAFYGDDLNAGTTLLPFKTKAKAESVGISGDNIVLGSGLYVEEIGANLNRYNYFGEGKVIIQKPLAATTNALNAKVERVENIIFFGWTGGTAVTQHTNAVSPVIAPVFINCQFVDCVIQAGITSSFGHYMACIFDVIEFDSNGQVSADPQAGGIFNCIFKECTGILPPLSDYIDGIFNNYFIDCGSFMVGVAIGQPTDKFDYNNIEGGLNGEVDNAAIQALGFNLNGFEFAGIDIFNDFDSLRSDAEYFIQDYTQKSTSPLLLASKSKGPVTRFNEGVRFDAAFIEGANSGISLVSLVGDQLVLDGGENVGFVKLNFDIGGIRKINLINILQEIEFNVGSGQAEKLADFLEDSGTDIKATYDIEIKHKKLLGDSFTISVVEYDKYIVDRSPQMIEARFFEINLTLRDYTI